jgi:inner membrane transporter RhtA
MFKSTLLLLIAMCSIQYGASIAKKIFPIFGASGSSALRLFFASLILVAFFRPWQRKYTFKQIERAALYGISLGLMNLFFYLSLEKIPLGVAVALEFSGPLAVAIFTSKKITDFVWAALAVVGIWLLFPSDQASSALDVQGMIYALSAGLFWALYIIFGKRVGVVLDAPTATTIGMIFAALIVIPVGFAQKGMVLFDFSYWPYALLVAFLSSALPYSLEMISLKNLPTRTFGILMSLEPVIATIVGFVFLHEGLTLTHYAAILCIIISSLGSTLTNSAKA